MSDVVEGLKAAVGIDDNDKRQKRAENLLSDINNIQKNVDKQLANIGEAESDIYVALDTMVKRAGYPSLEAYVEEKDDTDSLIRTLQKELPNATHGTEAILRKVIRGGIALVALGLLVGSTVHGVRVWYGVSASYQLASQAVRFTGQESVQLLSYARMAENYTIAAEARAPGGGGRIANVWRGMSGFAKASIILGAFLAVVDIGLAVWAVVNHFQDRDKLQKQIRDLCVFRLGLQQQELILEKIARSWSQAKSIVDLRVAFLEDDNNVLTPKHEAVLENKVQEAVNALKTELDKITLDSVYVILQKDDQKVSAWTDDDPSLQFMITEIKKAEKAEKDKKQ